MPTWAKVILIIFIIGAVAVAGMFGVGYYMWKKHGPGLVAGVEHGMNEGKEFGGKTDQQGCVDEGVKRQRAAAGFGDAIKSGVFVRSCLEASRETPGFCDAVPDRLEIMKTISWRREQCEKVGLPESQCNSFFQQVQQHCEKRKGN